MKSVIQVGKVFRSNGGELMKVESYDPHGLFNFRMLHPLTKEETGFVIEGESVSLPGFFKDTETKEIDLTTYEPYGTLVDKHRKELKNG